VPPAVPPLGRNLGRINVNALWRIALSTFPKARAVLRSSFLVRTNAVYVVVDGSRSPGRELAAIVFAGERGLSEKSALALIDERRVQVARTGIPFVLSAVVACKTLTAILPLLKNPDRRRIAGWLAQPVKGPSLRVVALAGTKSRKELLPLE
jgi:hypothetical protein